MRKAICLAMAVFLWSLGVPICLGEQRDVTLDLWRARVAYSRADDGSPIGARQRDYESVARIARGALEYARNRSVLWQWQVIEQGTPPQTNVSQTPFFWLVGHVLLDAALASRTDADRLYWSDQVTTLCQQILTDDRLRAAIRRLWSGSEAPTDRASSADILVVYNFSPEAMRRRTGLMVRRLDDIDRGLPKQDADYPKIVGSMIGLIQSARLHLDRNNQLPPDDWGVLAGLEWFHGPSQMRFEKGLVYISTDCLRKLGIPVTFGSGSLSLTNGLKTSQVRVGGAFASKSPTAFRGSDGAAFIPVTELKRLGLYEVHIVKEAQVAMISAEVPHAESPDADKDAGHARP